MSLTHDNITIPPETWLRKHARSVKGKLFSSLLWNFAGGLLIIIQAWLLATVCHRAVIDKDGLYAVLPLLGWLGLIALFRAVAVYQGEIAAVKGAADVRQVVRTALYRRLLFLKPAGVTGEVGALTEAVTSAVDALESYIARFLPQMFIAALLPLAVLIIVIPFEWRSSLVLIFSAPFIPLLMVLIGKGTEALNQRQWSRLSLMAGHLLDLVQGLPDLKIFGAAKREAELLADVSEQYRAGTMAILRVAFLSAFTLEFFSTVGTAVVAVIIGFRLLAGELPLQYGLFILLLAPEFYLPLRNLGLAYHSRMNGLAAARQIIPLIEQSPSLDNETSVCREKSANTVPPEIRCDSVSFSYGGNRGGVQDINLTIPGGSLVGIVGASGSGKSTLARLLLGLSRPESGTITVGGVELSKLDQDAWRSELAWVPQQPFFFNASIRENLLLGRPNATDEEIKKALEAAALSNVINSIRDGLDAVLGEGGAGLSGGELKRLALARVFIRGASVVVLDEPTAGLDRENEKLVLDSLEHLAVGRTMLIISHREKTINLCNNLFVLSDGRLESVVTPSDYFGGAV